MKAKRLTNKTFTITVEGECEKYYFEHLRNLINNTPHRKYNCEFKPTLSLTKKPLGYAKNFSFIKNRFFHIQDIEDYSNEEYKKIFENLLQEIKEANKYVKYRLGYTNFSFELWILLHKREMNHSVQSRKDYIEYINKVFKKSYKDISEYKVKDEFKSILSQITLDDVYTAIKRSKKIRSANDNKTSLAQNQKKIKYGNYIFYAINPDLDLHEVVEIMLKECLENKFKK